MPATKANKLRAQWTDAKIEMLAWIQKTISMMEPGTSAKDVESMVNATGKLIKMLGDIEPNAEGEGLEGKDLENASIRIRRATKGLKDIFSDGDAEDDDDED